MPDVLDAPDILTTSEAAALCGRTPQAMQKAALRGRLRARKVGRQWVTTRQSLSAYLALVESHEARRRSGQLGAKGAKGAALGNKNRGRRR